MFPKNVRDPTESNILGKVGAGNNKNSAIDRETVIARDVPPLLAISRSYEELDAQGRCLFCFFRIHFTSPFGKVFHRPVETTSLIVLLLGLTFSP